MLCSALHSEGKRCIMQRGAKGKRAMCSNIRTLELEQAYKLHVSSINSREKLSDIEEVSPIAITAL